MLNRWTRKIPSALLAVQLNTIKFNWPAKGNRDE